MKKMLDLVVTSNEQLNQNYSLIKLTTTDGSLLPEMHPGQFVEIKVTGSSSTFLRRPISINFVDKATNELWLLIQAIGEGTRTMCNYRKKEIVNFLFPLGTSYTIPEFDNMKEFLLIGGGVGIAPMLYLGAKLKENGFSPIFLLGARSKKDLLQLDEFSKYGRVYCATEDGSFGEKGFVTNHSILSKAQFSSIYTCGPKPMMMAVAKYANSKKINCEVSLENTMACGFGVCLCCVEKTHEGNNVCVCTVGPVFNIDELTWID